MSESTRLMRPEIRIIYPTKCSDYYFQYRIQSQPQPSGIEIDPEEATIRCFVNSEIGNVPGDIYRRRKIWIYVLNGHEISLKKMAQALDLIKPLAQVVCDGYDVEHDGRNWSGTLTDKAHTALSKIGTLLWEHDICCEGSNFPEDILYG